MKHFTLLSSSGSSTRAHSIAANDVVLGRPRVGFRRVPVPVEGVHEVRDRGFGRGVDRKVTVRLPPVGVPVRGVHFVVVGGVVGGGPVARGPAHFFPVDHPVLVVAVAVQVARLAELQAALVKLLLKR